jgi:hypothetical protein
MILRTRNGGYARGGLKRKEPDYLSAAGQVTLGESNKANRRAIHSAALAGLGTLQGAPNLGAGLFPTSVA